MNYLIFDIECCDGAHICEFGYVIADEKFEIKKKEYFLINPEERFSLNCVRGKGVVLNFSERDYRNSPTFPVFYDIIKNLLSNKEQKIIGFSMTNDAKFLENACKKYGKEPIKFKFYDMQVAFAALFNNGVTKSLEFAAQNLNVFRTDIRLHRSDEDALLTLRLAEAMCAEKKVGLEELLQMIPTALANSGQSIKEDLAVLETHPEFLSSNRKKKILEEFAFNMTPEKASGARTKKICFSTVYETEKTRDCIILMRKIIDEGNEVTFKVSEADVYVKHEKDEETKDLPGRRYHNLLLQLPKRKVRIISYDDLLSTMNLTEEEIEKERLPEFHKKEKFSVEQKSYKNTLGDYFDAKKLGAAFADSEKRT